MRLPRRRPEPSHVDEGSDPDPQVHRLRRRLRRQQRQIKTLRERLDKQRRELTLLRAASLDVFPDIDLPESLRRVIRDVRAEGLTFLAEMHLLSLAACVREMEEANRPGIVIEAGTARGGSAIVMAAAKEASRPMWVHDVFDTIPPPTAKDAEDAQARYRTIATGKAKGRGDEAYYGYRDDLIGEVTESFARHQLPLEDNTVNLVEGLFEDTLVVDQPVALAHVDGDWYASTMTCLERITPQLVPGGRIVIDDYHTWSGCRTAVDEFVAAHPEIRMEMRARVHLVRPHE